MNSNIIVEITCNSSGLVSITVDSIDLNIAPIKNRKIEDWFKPFSGRLQWDGLIAELKDTIQDPNADFDFVFIGLDEQKRAFYECLNSTGLYSIEKGESYQSDGNAKNSMNSVRTEVERLRRLGQKKEALAKCMTLVQEGDADGLYIAAELKSEMLDGQNHTENEKYEIFKYYELAYEKGHIEATNRLGEKYRAGYGVDENPEAAYECFFKAANGGSVEAMRNLGLCYHSGYGTREDNEEAKKWLLRPAEAGDTIAETVYGSLIANEADNEEKWELAKKYIFKAASKGHSDAQLIYGYVLHNDESVSWYRKAAVQGSKDACYETGICYELGKGVKEDKEEALEWYKKAAEMGHLEALSKVGSIYYSKEAYQEAVTWLKKAVDNDIPDGCYLLGLCYDYGIGIKQDKEKAVDLYRRAAEMGEVSAQYCLGISYQEGNGVNIDEKEAARWFKEAAENGDASAQEELGECYISGRGVDKDEKEALKWFETAAGNGSDYAQFATGCLYEYGEGDVPKNIELAKEWLQKAAENDFLDAQYEMGRIFAVESPVDVEKAFYWFKKYAENEEHDSEKLLRAAYTCDTLLMPEKMKSSYKFYLKAGVGTALAVIGIVALPPLVFGGAAINLSTLFSEIHADKKHYTAVLRTEKGITLLNIYKKAGELGNKDALKQYKKLSKLK